jgi:hypothetical protein
MERKDSYYLSVKKKNIARFISLLVIAVFLLSLHSCSDDVLNEIDKDPNNPLDVSVKSLMPTVTAGVPYIINGADLAWYSAVFSEQLTGTYLQMRDADRRRNINSELSQNAWNSIYANLLMNLQQIITKGSEGGSEAGYWHSVAIAQILKAYVISVTTDTWGRIPYSEALQGNINRTPAFDNQQDIYNSLQQLLDEAIVNIDKESTLAPGNEDQIYNGDMEQWKKAAYSLKARFYLKVAKQEAGAYQNAIDAAAKGFLSTNDDMTFSEWGGTADISHQNPWYREQVERGMLSISQTFYDQLNDYGDPRKSIFFTTVGGVYNPAPSGNALEDQNKNIYSRIGGEILYPTAPIPLMTYEELLFVEAEANLALGKTNVANFKYEKAVDVALDKYGIPPTNPDRDRFRKNTSMFPSQESLSLWHISVQKNIALFPFQSVEAYAHQRRTGYPQLQTSLAQIKRFPYPQSERSANPENMPETWYGSPVWWENGTED